MTESLFENENGNFAKPVLYEGGISRTTLSLKHVKRKRKNERGKYLI